MPDPLVRQSSVDLQNIFLLSFSESSESFLKRRALEKGNFIFLAPEFFLSHLSHFWTQVSWSTEYLQKKDSEISRLDHQDLLHASILKPVLVWVEEKN